MTGAQSLDLGPFHFTVMRLLLLLCFIRSLARNERLPGGINGLDLTLLMWGAWLLCSSLFHQPFSEALVFRLGAVYNTLGFYFLIRIFCRNAEDMIQLIKLTAFLLVPVALEMINEKLTGRNLFAILGGVPEDVMVRDGQFRAQGPFGHPLLAGTVGGFVCAADDRPLAAARARRQNWSGGLLGDGYRQQVQWPVDDGGCQRVRVGIMALASPHPSVTDYRRRRLLPAHACLVEASLLCPPQSD